MRTGSGTTRPAGSPPACSAQGAGALTHDALQAIREGVDRSLERQRELHSRRSNLSTLMTEMIRNTLKPFACAKPSPGSLIRFGLAK